MPFTFLAHQAPFLPLVRRRPRWLDGLCFTVGTMAPDLAYGMNGAVGTRVWAHAMPALLTFCVPVTLLVAWLIARVLAPVVPDHLPRAGPFAFADYRGLAIHRFGWVRSPAAAFAGALTHVGLDQFTHGWGWAAKHWDWYRRPLLDTRWLGKVWAPFEFMQFAGHVLLSLWCVVALARYGRRGWFADRAAQVRPFPATTRSSLTLWVAAAGCTLVGGLVVLVDPQSESSDVMRLFGAAFVGLALGSVLARASSPRVGSGSGGLEGS